MGGLPAHKKPRLLVRGRVQLNQENLTTLINQLAQVRNKLWPGDTAPELLHTIHPMAQVTRQTAVPDTTLLPVLD